MRGFCKNHYYIIIVCVFDFKNVMCIVSTAGVLTYDSQPGGRKIKSFTGGEYWFVMWNVSDDWLWWCWNDRMLAAAPISELYDGKGSVVTCPPRRWPCWSNCCHCARILCRAGMTCGSLCVMRPAAAPFCRSDACRAQVYHMRYYSGLSFSLSISTSHDLPDQWSS